MFYLLKDASGSIFLYKVNTSVQHRSCFWLIRLVPSQETKVIVFGVFVAHLLHETGNNQEKPLK